MGSRVMIFGGVRSAAENGSLGGVGAGIRLQIPAAMTNRLGAQAGKEITFGIRPEDLRIANGSDAAEMSIEAVVEVIEGLDSEILPDVPVGPGSAVAAFEPTVGAKVHEHVRLAVNPHRLHFFDNDSEAAA